MSGFEKGPTAAIRTALARSDIVGLPRIGSDNNYAFPTFQMNVSGVKVQGCGMWRSFFLIILASLTLLI